MIDFVQKDGTRQSFPYVHCMTAWMGIESNERFIKILFATHLVTIKGYCLDQLYNNLIQFKLKRVIENNERYLDQLGQDKPFVIEIKIMWKKEEK